MYVEEIVAKRNGKEYRTLLVRESFRVGSTVNHRTIANISHLPKGCVEEIKRYLKGNSGNLDFSQVQVVDSKEYGASQSALSFARKLELDNLIFSRKVQWREDVLAMTIGKLLNHGNEVSLANLFADTVLWESCGHSPNTLPDVVKHCYNPLNQLLTRKPFIQNKLANKHFEKGSIALAFLTTTIVEEEWENEFSLFSNNNERRHSRKEINTVLLTNFEGCPLAVETFSNSNENESYLKNEIKELARKLKILSFVIISHQEMLTNAIQEEFRTITALTPIQLNDLIAKNIIPIHLFSNDQLNEVADPISPSVRYILCLSLEGKKEQERARDLLIKKTEELLLKLQKKNLNVITEIEKIWTALRTEKFFNWRIFEGKLQFSLNKTILLQEQQLDGCYVIRTTVQKGVLSSIKVVNAYQKMNQIQKPFRTIKTIATDLCHIPLEDRIQAHVLLCKLSYYLQWHMNKKLEGVVKMDGEAKVRRWNFTEAIERLKSIRSQTLQVGSITLDGVKTTLDAEQREIISALGVTLIAKFSKN